MVASFPRTAEQASTGAPGSMLADLATACLVVVLPVLMIFANRSSPLVLGIAAALALAAALARSGAPSLLGSLGSMLRTPEAWAGSAFLVWALVSILWSVDRRSSLAAYGELIAPLAAGTLLAAALPSRLPGWATPALAVSLALVTLGVAVEIHFDFPIRRLWGGRLEDYVMNRPIVTATLLFWPLAAALRARGRNGLALAIFAVVAAGAIVSTSGTSKLSVLVGAAAFVCALAAPRLVKALAAPVLVLAMAVQPVFGLALSRAIPESGMSALSSAHARERVDIWITFGEVAMRRLATGTGFGSSPKLDKDPVALEVPERHRAMVAVGHPHDALLQAWTELGLPGALIGIVLLGLVGLRLARLPNALLPERAACAVAVLAIAMESHGAWQGWWIAAVAATTLLFPRLQPEHPAGGADTLAATVPER